jgi:hypothetical protein
MRLQVNRKYKDIFYTTCRYILLYGGRGSAKSYTTAQFFIIKAIQPEFFRGVLMREVLGDIRQSQFQEIKDILEDSGLIDEFNIRENTMEFEHKVTGNKIISKGFKKSSGNQTAKVKSIKDPTHIWIEEADEVSWDDFKKADTSVRTTKAEYVQIILTFNPEAEEGDESNWINNKFFKAERKDSLIIHSTYHDNTENLQPSYIQTLENLKEEDPNYYDVYVLGLWGTKQILNPFAYQYKKQKHESEKAVFDSNKQLLISIDFNLNPFGVTFSQMWRDQFGEHFHVVDEASIEKGSIPAMIDLIKLKYENQLANCIITGDAMGRRGDLSQRDNASNYEQLRRGLRLRESQIQVPPNPTHSASRNDVNYVLYHFPDFKINPVTCPNTCRDMRTVQADAFGHIIKKDRNDLSQRADMCDTIRYAINTHLRKWIDANMKYNKK